MKVNILSYSTNRKITTIERSEEWCKEYERGVSEWAQWPEGIAHLEEIVTSEEMQGLKEMWGLDDEIVYCEF